MEHDTLKHSSSLLQKGKFSSAQWFLVKLNGRMLLALFEKKTDCEFVTSTDIRMYSYSDDNPCFIYKENVVGWGCNCFKGFTFFL